jgi:membrane protease subunit (stomatin/prohibitin family)
VKTRLLADFRRYGLELIDFFVNAITPPPDVQRMIDERSGMGAVGNLDDFMKFKAAKALGDAAAGVGAGGGQAAGGLGMGVGAGLGFMLPGMIYRNLRPEDADPERIRERGTVNCPDCHTDVPLTARFCPSCGNQMVVANKCPQCGKNVTVQAKFCPACGVDLKARRTCGHCQTLLPPGTVFCTSCGERVAGGGKPSS